MFVTIDGPDGTGKTTIAKAVVELLKLQGIPAAYTSEPTDSMIGKRIRKILKNGSEEEQKQLTGLFIQDREWHIKNVIEPLLKSEKVVVCDRYKYSTICYQHLQGESIAELLEMNKRFPSPDLSIIFDVSDVDILVDRIIRRGLAKECFETSSNLEKSIQIYSNMPKYYPSENIVYIHSEGNVDEIAKEALSCVLENFLPSIGSESEKTSANLSLVPVLIY